MSQKKGKKVTVEEELNALKKHFGGIVATVKSLMETVKSLQNKDIKEIEETQRVMDEVVVANLDAIHQLKSETLKLIAAKEPIEDGNVLIKVIEMQNVMEKTTSKNADNVKLLDEEIKCMLKEINDRNASRKEIDDAIKRLDEEISDIKNERKDRKATVEEIIVGDKTKVLKKCRFFNTGYCKYKQKCRFAHPKEDCKDSNCEGKECPYRHPKGCKWMERTGGCRREHFCDYSHDTIKTELSKTRIIGFKCVSCKSAWSENKFVVEHTVNQTKVYFLKL